MANINKISVAGTIYDLQDKNAAKTVELTQEQYDALDVKEQNVFYIITDATAGDLSNYYTKQQTDTLLGEKQPTLVSGTNIKTINNESLLGEGNLNIQGGGGKAIEAGRGISITTGETADTVSFNLPISAGTETDSIIIGYRNLESSDWDPIASGKYSIASGPACKARGENSLAFGYSNDVYGNNDVAIGYGNKIENNRNKDAFAFGLSNTITSDDYVGISARASAVGGYKNIVKSFVEFGVGNSNNTSYSSNTFGDSGNTLFSVGNGNGNPNVYQTTINRHNAFEVRQNGDIYVPNTDDTSVTGDYAYSLYPMVRLQDTITATAANTTALGGLKLVKISQSQYDALQTKDSSTLYIIVN